MLSDEDQIEVLATFRRLAAEMGVKVVATASEPEVDVAQVESNPEQIPAPNQNVIDRDFNDLMKGIEL
jgi:hypothetical protein